MEKIRGWVRSVACGYIPAYASDTLGPLQRWLLELWLTRDAASRRELRKVQILRAALQTQVPLDPRMEVHSKIMAAVHRQTPGPAGAWRVALNWIPLLVLICLAGFLLWRALPPGLEVEWTVEGEQPTTFRIYRASGGPTAGVVEADQFMLLDQLPAREGVDSYRYTDLRLVPGQRYIYRVEAEDQSGSIAASQNMIGDSLDALPRQLILAGVLGVILVLFLVIIRDLYPLFGYRRRFSIT